MNNGYYSNPVNTIPSLQKRTPFSPLPKEADQRTVFKNGHLVDPKNHMDHPMELAIKGGMISEVAKIIQTHPDDLVINCQGLYLLPGLIDIHLHLGDLFDINERPLFKAARDGVTLGLSPGAGNTFMAPSLLGAEVDRGIPINAGVYLGAAAVLGTMLSIKEIIRLFVGELEDSIMSEKLTRNAITNSTANLTVGIKDHMGHFIMPDEKIDALFEISSKAHLIYMSHTQDPEHAQRMAKLSKDRPLHLAHATAAGCGTHDDPVKSMESVLTLVDHEVITAEFVSSMLLESRGRRDGLRIEPHAQELAYRALQDGLVDIIISDGQSGATMKGFGDTSDNLRCIFTLADLGVLSLPEAVATMTLNPARFLSKRLNNPFFEEHLGHLAVGALANITIADRFNKEAVYTVVNGQVVAFEANSIRENMAAGCLVSKEGFTERPGVGDLALYLK